MANERDVTEAAERNGVESAGQRFGRLVKAFRQRNLPDQLVTHQLIHDLGGPTRNVQSRIESGQVDTISATTEAKYNRALEALGLPAGSVTAALHHGGALGPPAEEKSTAAAVEDDVENGVNALQNLTRNHRSVANLVTELDRLGIELKRARSHTEGYQLVFPKTAVDRLLHTLKNAAKPAFPEDGSDRDDTPEK
ncbi:hypothetical protein [Umezawaea sp.]|uniref:hypothetical protein n=1 Tax=Umezawaea sp. TaxID=1955258 RepID=UPI002ED1FAB2